MKSFPEPGKGTPPMDGWKGAVALLVAFERGREHLDDLLEKHPPGRDHGLVMETFRQWFRIDRLLQERLRKPPRPRVRALLRLALAEVLWHGLDRAAAVVHHTVECGRGLGLSPMELRFLNGVLRAVVREEARFAELRADPSAAMPEWLWQRWCRRFGHERARELCRWNERMPPWYVRMTEHPLWAEATPFVGFYRVRGKHAQAALAALAEGRAYAQDPFAAIPVDLLDPRPGETIHDYCAAPGGKSREIAFRMKEQGRLLALDRPGPRSQRLEQNLRHLDPACFLQIRSSLEAVTPQQLGGPADGVLVDVPCSNTGVIARRPDVKVRLRECDIAAFAELQLALLEKAAGHVRTGGRLVYSTCSLEEEENESVVGRFLSRNKGWVLRRRRLSFPPEAGHDGGGAFLLTSAEGHQEFEETPR